MVKVYKMSNSSFFFHLCLMYSTMERVILAVLLVGVCVFARPQEDAGMYKGIWLMTLEVRVEYTCC